MSMRAIAVSLFALVLLAGCGGDDDDSNGGTTGAPPATEQTDEGATDASSDESSGDEESDANESDGSIEILAARGGKPNARADTTVRTSPNATCSISFITPDGDEAEDPGLVEKTASGNGRVSWSWRLAADLTPGTGTVSVTCNDVTVEEPIEIG